MATLREILGESSAPDFAVAPITDPSTENESVSGQGIEVTPAEVYRAIGDVLENVWLSLTENMSRAIQPEQIPDWVETLSWAVEVMPLDYERHVEIIKAELDYWQSFL